MYVVVISIIKEVYRGMIGFTGKDLRYTLRLTAGLDVLKSQKLASEIYKHKM